MSRIKALTGSKAVREEQDEREKESFLRNTKSTGGREKSAAKNCCRQLRLKIDRTRRIRNNRAERKSSHGDSTLNEENPDRRTGAAKRGRKRAPGAEVKTSSGSREHCTGKTNHARKRRMLRSGRRRQRPT
jgi:hypothetical protein